jgi:hypothetical protein
MSHGDILYCWDDSKTFRSALRDKALGQTYGACSLHADGVCENYT